MFFLVTTIAMMGVCCVTYKSSYRRGANDAAQIIIKELNRERGNGLSGASNNYNAHQSEQAKMLTAWQNEMSQKQGGK